MTLALRHITKAFGATRAVEDVSLELRRGEIAAIVGENGAGKTTLMRIAAREIAADGGAVEAAGPVALVHQHFMLVGELTIAENLALLPSPFRLTTRRSIERDAEATIALSGIGLAGVSRRVDDLSVGEKAKLELVKAIARRPRTLILDEPTSVLTPGESDELFAVMRTLASRGTAVVLITHKLREVLAVAERVIVMRGGRVVVERNASDTTLGELANAMVQSTALQAVVAPSLRSDARAPWPSSKPALEFEDVSAYPREIVAIVGVAGNGQSELAARLRDHLRGEGHIPEDRKRDGVVAEMTIAENLALKSGRFRPAEALRHAARMIELYSIRCRSPRQRAGDLSGGNQQKVILARELDRRPHVLVAAEPTRGLDIEATAFVHEQLRNAADAGAAILLITSDLDEAFALATTIQVMYRGRLSTRMTPAEAAPRVAGLMAGAV